jgi:hypothetical protein
MGNRGKISFEKRGILRFDGITEGSEKLADKAGHISVLIHVEI